MESLGLIFVMIGVAGLALATFAVPVLAVQFARKRSEKTLLDHSAPRMQSLSIWVAAHNEEKVIAATLTSLLKAIDCAKASGVNFRFELGVALDHCADSTLDQIELFEKNHETDVLILENPGEGAKWWNLKNIISHVSTDWVALVDAGSIWDEKLIVRAIEEMKSDVVAIAPSYAAKNSGISERLNWKLESFLKRFENKVGGPVTVHGASVIYRVAPLKSVMTSLGEELWLNDDVVVPLSLRIESLENRIVYLGDHTSGWVSDVGVRSELDLEYRRRRRMVYGNIQWIQKVLLSRKGFSAPMPFFLALRRVFRLFWAYWVLLLGVGIAFLSPLLALSFGLVGALALFKSQFLRRVGMAFWSGLQVPNLWREYFLSKRGVTWS